MKKTLFFFVLAFLASTSWGQVSKNTLDPKMEKSSFSTSSKSKTTTLETTEAIAWSEDFSSGIPADWTNAGFDGNLSPLTLCKWEYRGPSTTPNSGTGSRGAWANANDPITSPTASNGFVIFDSDYLDSDGIQGNAGNGNAPAPHVGTLTTDSIDLTNHPYVELNFHQYARNFQAIFQVAFSTDGGSTWTDTLDINPGLGTNVATSTNDIVTRNISSICGGQNNVRMRFIFDGRPGNANGNGYYFWLIDDISITDIPGFKLTFIDLPNGAPAHDIIFNNDGISSKHLILTLKQSRPICFDSNILNYGWKDQTGVTLGVDILDENGNLVQNLSSNAHPSTLVPNDIATFATMTTTTCWTPTNTGTYQFVYYATADSISKGGVGMPADTFSLFVTDSLTSLDGNQFTNQIGTDNLGDDGSEIGVRIDLGEPERLFGAQVVLSSNSSSGGLLEFEVYDTTGFDYVSGFANPPLVSTQHVITAQELSDRRVYVDFTADNNGNPLMLPSSSYYVTMRMFSNAGINNILIGNDQTFDQPNASSIMYITSQPPNRWYSGFTGSKSLNAPMIRTVMCSANNAATCMSLAIKEIELVNNIKIGQDLRTESIFIKELSEDIVIHKALFSDINGKEVLRTDKFSDKTAHEIYVGQLSKGVYLLSVHTNQGIARYKINIQ